MKIARVHMPLLASLLAVVVLTMGCKTTDGTASIGAKAEGPKGDVFTKTPAAGKIDQDPSHFVFCGGPLFGSNKQVGLSVKLEDTRLHVLLVGTGFIWVEGDYGKAETENVVAYAEHTRFVMQIDGNTMRVFHYNHSGQQLVRVYIKRSDEKYLSETSYVELTRASSSDPWTFVSDPIPFLEDFSNLPTALSDFLKAVEDARIAAGLPDHYP